MTNSVSTPPAVPAEAGGARAKKPWAMPSLLRIDSGAAETGNGLNAEGQLAFGS